MATQKPVISIDRVGNLLTLRPVSVFPLVQDALTWFRQERDPAGGRILLDRDNRPVLGNNGKPRRTPQFISVPEPLYKVQADQLVTFAGFRWRLFELLKPYGTVQYRDPRDPTWLMPAPRTDNLGAFRHKQDDALQAIWQSDGNGIVFCTTGWGKSEEIAKICLSYSGLENYPIVVAAPDRQTCENLVTRIGSYGLDVGWVDGGHNKRRQVTVVSAMSLLRLADNGDLGKVRLLLFDEVHRAAMPTARRAFLGMQQARFFGFTATAEGRSDKGETVIEAFFGRTICRVQYQEAVDAGTVVPIVVVGMQTTGPDLANIVQPTTKTRHGVWRNTARNEALASVAAQLVQLGQVLLVTHTLEHALNIYKLLPPGWILVYGTHPGDKLRAEQRKAERDAEDDADAGEDPFGNNLSRAAKRAEGQVQLMTELGVEKLTNARRDELKAQFAAGQIRGAVCTHVWGTGADFRDLAFVMHADGLGSVIGAQQQAGRSSRLPFATNKKLGIVIDTEDEFDATMTRRKQSRFRVYKQNGWQLIRHKDPAEVAGICQQLLNGQPSLF